MAMILKKKRIFDLTLSIIGFLLLLPMMLIIALLILLFSGRPILYKQKRVGENGALFTILKFRTMTMETSHKESQIHVTVLDDPRITRIGKILRRFKMDEIPEILNVMKGEMSFVGPRPDVPGYADKLKGKDRKVLKMKPGVTGPATLKYANEEQILAKVIDPVKYNNEIIFPDKIKINLEYIDNWSLKKDIIIILKTIFRSNY